MNRDVYIVGLDGVPPEVAECGIDSGHCPSLGTIRESGASGVTESTIPPLSMMAWSTFATGQSPGNHGIYNFILKDRNGNGSHFANYTELQENSIPFWEYLDAEGVSTGIVNVMPGYPPSKSSGFHISDHITTPSEGNFAYPPSIQEDLDSITGEFEHAPITGYTPGNPDELGKFIRRFLEIERNRTAFMQKQITEQDTDLTTIVFSGPDVFLHEVGHLLDETHPKYDLEIASEYADSTFDLLNVYDEFLSWLMEFMDDEDVLMVLSDHGHGPVYSAVNLNSWLYQNGYLELKSTPLTKAKVIAYNRLYGTAESIFKRFGLYDTLKLLLARGGDDSGKGLLQNLLTFSQRDIDWDETRAYTIAGDGQIFVNAPAGSQEYYNIRDDLRRDLVEISDPDRGVRIVDEILDGEEVYPGRYTDTRPDLVCVPTQGYRFKFPQTMRTSEHLVNPQKWSSHTSEAEREGIFYAYGGPVLQNGEVQVKLSDFAPSAFRLLDVPVPESFEGTARTDVFKIDDDYRFDIDGKVRAKSIVRSIIESL